MAVSFAPRVGVPLSRCKTLEFCTAAISKTPGKSVCTRASMVQNSISLRPLLIVFGAQPGDNERIGHFKFSKNGNTVARCDAQHSRNVYRCQVPVWDRGCITVVWLTTKRIAGYAQQNCKQRHGDKQCAEAEALSLHCLNDQNNGHDQGDRRKQDRKADQHETKNLSNYVVVHLRAWLGAVSLRFERTGR